MILLSRIILKFGYKSRGAVATDNDKIGTMMRVDLSFCYGFKIDKEY
jgi:hypothetical protein